MQLSYDALMITMCITTKTVIVNENGNRHKSGCFGIQKRSSILSFSHSGHNRPFPSAIMTELSYTSVEVKEINGVVVMNCFDLEVLKQLADIMEMCMWHLCWKNIQDTVSEMVRSIIGCNP